MNRNAQNTGPTQSRAADRRRKEAVEIETGAAGEGGRLPGMTKEYTGWDVYNNEAKKVDTELVNDWRDSLNSLLLFAAIFAAVLTAFIIESKKMLELDPTSVMMDVMIFYTNSIANGTHKIYIPPDFQPDSWAVTVNCLFFASLGASLVAALASVVSLQWVADYDAAITRGGSSPEDRAKRRQFRYAGVVCPATPALFLGRPFFGGLALWMWEVNHVVGFVVVGGAALAVLFYGVSTLLAVVFVSAPFRTPLGRWIYSSVRRSFSFVSHLAGFLHIPIGPAWLEKRNLSSAISRRREDQEMGKKSEMRMAALVWLANELSVSQDSYDRLILLVRELIKLHREIPSFPGFLEAPWFLIFDLVGWRNLKRNPDEPITPQDMESFAVLSQCYRIPEIYEIISPTISMQYVKDTNNEGYWGQYCDISESRWSPKSSVNRPNSLFLLLRDIPLPSADTIKDIEITIRLSRWRNAPHVRLKPSEEFDPRIGRSTTDAASINESIVNLEIYHNADGLALWSSKNNDALYLTIMRRMISILGAEGTIPPAFLDALRWRFELLVVGADNMSESACLSIPVHYRDALDSSSETDKSLHYVFTLLLARNLGVFAGAEAIFRVKEILTMMWLSPVSRWLGQETVDRVGVESFFDANKPTVMGWVENGQRIPHIHEILRHLRIAHAKEPGIGSLWRVIPTQEGHNPPLFAAIFKLDNLGQGVTPKRHYEIIDLVCQDLALDPVGAFKNFSTGDILEDLQDPCLRFLCQSYAGVAGESVYLSPGDIDGPWKESWARIATHFMRHTEGTRSPFILGLQGSLWPVIPNRRELCAKALQDPEFFTHLQHMFEQHVACQQHHSVEGHLLLHIFERFQSIEVSADMTAFTRIPITGRSVDMLLSMMIISDNRYRRLSKNLRLHIHEQCLARALEIGRELRASQYRMLAFLSQLPGTLIASDEDSRTLCSEEVASMSIGVTKALDLPGDPRVALVIPDLVSGIQKIKEKMYSRNWRSDWENQTADKEATIASNRLMTHLACMKIFGNQNLRMLFCSQAWDSHSPALGWLAMHTE